MPGPSGKNKMIRLVRQFLWPLVSAVLLLALFLPGYTKIQELRDKNRDIAEKNRRLAIENKLLQTELERLEKDALYQEKILREKMGVVRKDEIPVKIIAEEKE